MTETTHTIHMYLDSPRQVIYLYIRLKNTNISLQKKLYQTVYLQWVLSKANLSLLVYIHLANKSDKQSNKKVLLWNNFKSLVF